MCIKVWYLVIIVLHRILSPESLSPTDMGANKGYLISATNCKFRKPISPSSLTFFLMLRSYPYTR